LDSPAALGVEQTRHVLDLLRRLKARGVGVVFIGHTMQQVLEICDRINIIRQGRTVGTVHSAEVSGNDFVSYNDRHHAAPPKLNGCGYFASSGKVLMRWPF
jgi:ABC-type sugar transport system ATPase subunit